jgi:FkbM family methyltransferase
MQGMIRSTILAAIRLVLRNLPLKSGTTRIAFNPVMAKLFADFQEPVTARLTGGTPIEVDPNDYHGRILYLFGTNDPKVAHTALALMRPGHDFLDIGANYASIGLEVARRPNASGTVHLFEPQKILGDRVEAAITAAGLKNVRLHRVGLLDVDGSFELRTPQYHSGRATFAAHGDGAEFSRHEICEVRAIESYVGPLVADTPFGVKIDIEGSEPKVMPWLLAHKNLRFVIFEAANEQDVLYRQIREAGFSLYGLERFPLRMRYRRIDSFDQLLMFHDILAFKSELNLPERAGPTQLAGILGSRP